MAVARLREKPQTIRTRRPLVIAWLVSCLGATVLVGCGRAPERWYTDQQVERGRAAYETYCLACHGVSLEGVADWKIPLADGALPPPPLNGSAHTWHHDKALLLRIIDQGGIPFGGVMPSFRDVLSVDERTAVLAYVQSHWSNAVYRTWASLSENATR